MVCSDDTVVNSFANYFESCSEKKAIQDPIISRMLLLEMAFRIVLEKVSADD